jgi:hypothetical protein
MQSNTVTGGGQHAWLEHCRLVFADGFLRPSMARTFVAGLRLTGIAAPMPLDGLINRDVFQAYVEPVTVPELAPGDIVIMDALNTGRKIFWVSMPALHARQRSRDKVVE